MKTTFNKALAFVAALAICSAAFAQDGGDGTGGGPNDSPDYGWYDAYMQQQAQAQAEIERKKALLYDQAMAQQPTVAPQVTPQAWSLGVRAAIAIAPALGLMTLDKLVTEVLDRMNLPREIGAFLCTNCYIIDAAPTNAELLLYQQFITAVVGPHRSGGAFKPGDKVDICDGDECLTFEYQPDGSATPWKPRGTKLDTGKYKNPLGGRIQTTAPSGSSGGGREGGYQPGATWGGSAPVYTAYDSYVPRCCVTTPPPSQWGSSYSYGGGGGWGGVTSYVGGGSGGFVRHNLF